MFYHLLYPLHVYFSFFNVFRYITFRTIYAILTALLISFIVGPWLIKKLRFFQIQQVVREDVPARHMIKNGTPTMGGSLIIAAIAVISAINAMTLNPVQCAQWLRKKHFACLVKDSELDAKAVIASAVVVLPPAVMVTGAPFNFRLSSP